MCIPASVTFHLCEFETRLPEVYSTPVGGGGAAGTIVRTTGLRGHDEGRGDDGGVDGGELQAGDHRVPLQYT